MTWHIAVTHPSCERRVSAGLTERGFEVWFPTRPVEFKTRYMKKPAIREYALFPSYIFTRGGSYHDMIGVDGFRTVLCNDWRPLTVSDEEIERLRHRLENPEPQDEDLWQVGQLVWVSNGPFYQMSGTIASGVRRGTVSVLMEMLGRPTPVEMPVDQLERVA